jgi:hypothetical protein
LELAYTLWVIGIKIKLLGQDNYKHLLILLICFQNTLIAPLIIEYPIVQRAGCQLLLNTDHYRRSCISRLHIINLIFQDISFKVANQLSYHHVGSSIYIL